MPVVRRLQAALLVGIALAACGGYGGSGTPPAAQTTPPTAAPSDAPGAVPSDGRGYDYDYGK